MPQRGLGPPLMLRSSGAPTRSMNWRVGQRVAVGDSRSARPIRGLDLHQHQVSKSDQQPVDRRGRRRRRAPWRWCHPAHASGKVACSAGGGEGVDPAIPPGWWCAAPAPAPCAAPGSRRWRRLRVAKFHQNNTSCARPAARAAQIWAARSRAPGRLSPSCVMGKQQRFGAAQAV